jgi:hypothetical protein
LRFWIRVGLGLGIFGIWGNGQRRGTDVNTLEIGSRDAQKFFWGNLGIYAKLRRELDEGWGGWSSFGGFGKSRYVGG